MPFPAVDALAVLTEIAFWYLWAVVLVGALAAVLAVLAGGDDGR